MHVSGKMGPVKTVPRMVVGINENDGGGKFYDIL
jgi:hypothetical protein